VASRSRAKCQATPLGFLLRSVISVRGYVKPMEPFARSVTHIKDATLVVQSEALMRVVSSGYSPRGGWTLLYSSSKKKVLITFAGTIVATYKATPTFATSFVSQSEVLAHAFGFPPKNTALYPGGSRKKAHSQQTLSSGSRPRWWMANHQVVFPIQVRWLTLAEIQRAPPPRKKASAKTAVRAGTRT
jgi:hypothetical protein